MAVKRVPEAVAEIMENPAERIVSVRLPLTRELQDDVFVRVNQRTWQIKRGVTVQVPACVAEVLENSERAMLEAIEYQNAHVKE